jgi:hypothetical protein
MILKSAEEYKIFEGVNQSRLKLIDNPSLFQNIKKDDDEDGEPDHFKFGTYIDDKLIGLATDDKYIVSDLKKFPPDEIKKVLDKFVITFNPSLDIDTYKDQLIAYCKVNDVYTSFKDDTVFGKIKKYEDYFNFMQSSSNKITLTSEQSMMGEYYKNLLTTDPVYSKYYVDSEGIENRKKVRLAIDFNYSKASLFKYESNIVSLKGELDSLKINHNTKTYTVVDDKTTADPYNFVSSIFKYRYDFQLAFYNLLVYQCREELGIKDYTPEREAVLIAIGSKYPQPPLIYKLDYNKVAWNYKRGGRTYMGIYPAIERYLIHRNTGIWNTPTEMIENGFINIDFE